MNLRSKASDENITLSKLSYTTPNDKDISTINSFFVKIKSATSDVMNMIKYESREIEKKMRRRNLKIPETYHRGYIGTEQEGIVDVGFGTVKKMKDVQFVNANVSQLKELNKVIGEGAFRPNFNWKTLNSTRRNRQKWGANKADGVRTSFDRPMAMYLQYLGKIANSTNALGEIIDTLKKCFSKIKNTIKTDVQRAMCDDIIRTWLSAIDEFTFYHSYDSRFLSQTLTPLHGLSTMGGPRGWVEEDVHNQIDDWVTTVKEIGSDDGRSFLDEQIAEICKEWTLKSEKNKSMSFEEYITDPMRWATSGGAPSVLVDGTRIRSKWAWALDALDRKENIYTAAKAISGTAKVALKEEKKLRTVITTPMDSYLRQCYILYRLGRAPLNSTISDPRLIENLARTSAKWYMSIDASKFDHYITKREVLLILAQIRSNTKDEELIRILDDEIASIKNLKIEYNGKIYDYNNGLLSGWRLTSLIGSMHSEIVCRWIKMKSRRQFNYLVQGDDIILYGDEPIAESYIVELCSDFGLVAHPQKTRSGDFGEFLKYRYSNAEISGYPARTVRGIFYSNPWLDNSVETKPQEVAMKWYTLMSRLMMSSNILPSKKSFSIFEKNIVTDVFSWSGMNAKINDVWDAMKTPISMGGLSCLEMCDLSPAHKHTAFTRMETVYPDVKTKFYSLFMNLRGVVKVERRSLTHKQKIDIFQSKKRIYSQPIYSFTAGKPRYDHDVNIFRSIIETVSTGRSILKVDSVKKHLFGKHIDCTPFYPRYLKKTSNWYERLKTLMTGDDVGAPISMLAGCRYNSNITKLIKSVTSRYMANLRSIVPGTKWIMAGFSLHTVINTVTLFNSL